MIVTMTPYRCTNHDFATASSDVNYKTTVTGSFTHPAARLVIQNLTADKTISVKLGSTSAHPILIPGGGELDTLRKITEIPNIYVSNSSGSTVTVQVLETPVFA